MLRPYSALGYAWDEPALPHRLLLALPGNRRLGVFKLDKACSLGSCAVDVLLCGFCAKGAYRLKVIKSDQKKKLVQGARCALSLGVSVLSFWCFWCKCRNAVLPGSTAARQLLVLKVGSLRRWARCGW